MDPTGWGEIRGKGCGGEQTFRECWLILERAGLQRESCTLRHVNRRTDRRADEYFEEILVARAL